MCPARASRQVGRRVDVAEGRPWGRGRARSPPGDLRGERLWERTKRRSPARPTARPPRAPARGAPPSAADGRDRRGRGRTASTPGASSSASIDRRPRRQRGMSPPTTMTIGSRAARGRPGARRVGPRRRRGRGRPRPPSGSDGVARRGDHEGSRSTAAVTASMASEERPAVDALGQLVPPEPARAATREDQPADAARRHARRPPDRRAGPGTWPSGVRRRIAAPIEVPRIAITYLRLVPVASRSAAGVSGAAARASAPSP